MDTPIESLTRSVDKDEKEESLRGRVNNIYALFGDGKMFFDLALTLVVAQDVLDRRRAFSRVPS